MEEKQSKAEKRAQFIREMKEREAAEKVKSGKKRRVRLIAAIVAAVLLLLAIAGIFAYKTLAADGYFMRKTVSMATEHFTVDNAMMTYFVQNAFLSDKEQYGDEFKNYNLDPDKKLGEQTYQDGTWLDQYLSTTEKQVDMMLTLAEAATDNGVALDDYEKKRVDETLGSINLSNFAAGIKESDIRNCLELLTLAAKYQKILYDSFTYSDENYQSYYEKHLSDIAVYDCISYTIETDTVGNSDAAAAYAKELYACSSDDTFLAQIRSDIKSIGADMSDEECEAKVNACMKKGETYTADDIGSWAYDTATTVGSNYLYNDTANNRYTVVRITKLPYQDTTKTVNVRHILFTETTYGTARAAKTRAEDILKTFEGDPCEAYFENLAHLYSEDNGSKSSGGLYENIYQGEMTAAFNDWCFDEARKPGDTGIVQTDYGFHLLYFIADGLPRWQATVDETRREADFNTLYTTLTEKYVVTYVTRGLEKIDL